MLPGTAQRASWARGLWWHARGLFISHPDFLKQFATAFSGYSDRIDATPSVKRTKSYGSTIFLPDDISVTARVELLLQWWEASGQDKFIDKSLALLIEGKLDLSSSRDGPSLPELHWWVSNLVDVQHPVRVDLLTSIAARLIEAIDGGMEVDEFVQTIKNVRQYIDDAPEEVDDAIDRIVRYELIETRDAISHLDSEQSLSEYLEHLDSLAELTGYDATDAKQIVYDRLGEFEEPDHGEHQPSFSGHGHGSSDEFGDAAVASLFASLIK